MGSEVKGMVSTAAWKEYEEQLTVISQRFRQIGMELEREPEMIATVVEEEPLRIYRKQMLPPDYNDEPVKTADGTLFYGLTCQERVRSFEKLAYGDFGVTLACPGPSLSGMVIQDLADEEQQDRYYTRLVEKPTWTFFALTEPGYGSDPMGMETRLTKEQVGDGYRLHGEKMFIGNGARADVGVVFARKTSGPLGIEVVLVETNHLEGFKADSLETWGVRAAGLSRLTFTHCHIAEEQVVGRHLRPMKRGMMGAVTTFNKMRPSIAAAALGIAQAAYDYVYEQRRQWLEAEKTTLQNLELELISVRQLIRRAAEEVDANPRNGHYASVAKVQASSLAERMTDSALMLMGAGSIYEHPCLYKWYRDARACEFMEGTSHIQKQTVFQAFMSGKMQHV
ncbi:acyl-CoA dehydrogenase family protein [Mechercharimyces sp. CAU 1602]|uniref:acyl-CoA dehydrogenase family protein n=1 Tax=Mechercharimyces sp. CAU 1602 TaxID=2973933 RepID=UPI0021618E65|nr:acyl-CoA dehydrogenase [Mechercharimyces sp. CAU 1602]MCS1352496.1 acyl-CoA dehydrogenase [Mechercharimyces sp. CAU 1602]